MEQHTKATIIDCSQKAGLKVKAKTPKLELATQLADKLTEGLIPDERNDDQRQAEDEYDKKAALISMVLTRSIQGDDKASFTDFIKMNATTSTASDGKESWTKENQFALEVLQIDEIQSHLLDEHLEIRQNLIEHKARIMPVDTDFETYLNDTTGKVILKVVFANAFNYFIFGFKGDTKFGELFEALQSKGVDVGSPPEQPAFVLKNKGGKSSAFAHEIISDWTSGGDADAMELVPLLHGGGKSVKKIDKGKMIVLKTNVSPKASSIDKAPLSTLPIAQTLEQELSSLMSRVEQGGCVGIIDNLIANLSYDDTVKTLEELKNANGCADYRVSKISSLLLGQNVQQVAQLKSSLSNVLDLSEHVMQLAFYKAMEEDNTFSMRIFKKKLEEAKFKKLGALNASTMTDANL